MFDEKALQQIREHGLTPEQVVVDGDKAKQWIKNGAQPTETVRGLFKKHGVID